MNGHWNRSSYYIIGIGEVEEPSFISHSGPSPQPSDTVDKAVPINHPHRKQTPIGKFGYMFPKLKKEIPKEADPKMLESLVALGKRMNIPSMASSKTEDSTIDAGYTYLGQFIAHEVSFDKTKAPFNSPSVPGHYRSPQIDLDSLYGLGPKEEPRLYQDGARLKIGETIARGDVRRTFLNDLPRAGYGRRNPKLALIADRRNDDNLATAQLHVALARFHNRVVDTLEAGDGFQKGCPLHPQGCPPRQLFTCARREVVQHFQAIILYDFLPKILDMTALKSVNDINLARYQPDPVHGLYMPLEFSVAAFRFGHSMVRGTYEWNYLQSSEPDQNGEVELKELFQFTNFSGNLNFAPRLRSDWIIDWRRFFDFSQIGYPHDERKRNVARKIDTAFNLHLDQIHRYPAGGFSQAHREITVRNLLRGYSLGLPTGEDVAQFLGEIPLKPSEVACGDDYFEGCTPLWYYILREAGLNAEGKLGSVGSCIVGHTIVGLIRNSQDSILKEKDWRPRFGDRAAKDESYSKYEMADLIDFADVVDPIGQHFGRRGHDAGDEQNSNDLE